MAVVEASPTVTLSHTLDAMQLAADRACLGTFNGLALVFWLLAGRELWYLQSS